MSPSKRPPATAPALVRVVASAPRDTEVFLIDHSFALVRRSVGTLDEHVPPGIYTLKFRRGTTVREVIKIVPSEAAIVEVPFPDDLQSLETAQTRGPAGVTLLGIPQAAPMPESAQAPPSGDSLRVEVWPAASGASHPAAGLTIRDASGALRRDLGTLTASDPLSMVASDLDLPPGCYRLRLALGDPGEIEQTIVVSPGWQTHVWLRARNYGTADTPLWRADLSETAVLMARPGHRPDPEGRSYAELAKSWLMGPQEKIALAHARELSTSTPSDPHFALCIAHTLVRKSSEDRRAGRRVPRERRTLVEAIVEHLTTLVPEHPDVNALSLWLGRVPTSAFDVPPMLLSSWALIAEASARRPTLVPRGSLAARVADHLWGSAVWLLWRSDRLAEGPQPETAPIGRRPTRASHLSLLMARLADLGDVRALCEIGTAGETTGHDAGSLTDLERHVLQALSPLASTKAGPQPAPSPTRGSASARSSHGLSTELVKRLGVPSASVDQAIASLLHKLKS